MSLTVWWAQRAEDDLRRLPDWRLAEMAANAVRRYADESIGFVLHVTIPNGPDEYRLLIPRTRTYVLVRRTGTTLYVERVVYRP